MTDIELVVKIPKEYYELVLEKCKDPVLLNAFKNGIELSKGHGDLKDMDDIYEALEGWNDDTGWIVDTIDFQTETVVKADDEEVDK